MGLNLTVLDHPRDQALVGELRNKDTNTARWRAVANVLSERLAYTASRQDPTKTVNIATPMGETTTVVLEEPMTIIPVLRAGLAMLSGVLNVWDSATVQLAGVARDHDTHQPHWYLPLNNTVTKTAVICDPMLATGGSLMAVGEQARKMGAQKIYVLTLIASKPGIDIVAATHPEWELYTAAVDDTLDANAYIIPGLGDAGDRWTG